MANEKRLIYADAAMQLIKNFGKGAISDGQTALDPVDDIILLSGAVDYIPTVDAVEVVYGRWIPTECGTLCSACHRVYDNDFEIRKNVCIELKRCPDCGAKMDGETG